MQAEAQRHLGALAFFVLQICAALPESSGEGLAELQEAAREPQAGAGAPRLQLQILKKFNKSKRRRPTCEGRRGWGL